MSWTLDHPAVGAVECNSIAAGVHAADEAVKASSARLVTANCVCAGKYLFLLTGSAAAVRSSLEAARASVPEGLGMRGVYIARQHPDLLPAVTDLLPVREPGALGSVECYGAIELLGWADAVAKSHPVRLREIALARGLGGKSSLSFTGDVASVRSAVEEIARGLDEEGLLADRVVLPRPSFHPPSLRGAGCTGP